MTNIDVTKSGAGDSPTTKPVVDKIDERVPESPTVDLREQAVARLKKRRDFRQHLLIYVLANGFFVMIWAVTSSGFFWPIFPMAGWGIGVVMNAWDVYRPAEFREDEINHEMRRLQGSR